jgi:predicted MFS family arabinose efflux permease
VNSTLVIACQSMQALAFGGIALFLPLIRDDFGISFSQAGMLAATTTIFYAVMQIPAGIMADRYDAKRLFAIGLLGVNILSLTLALLDSFGLLLVNQAVSGVFRALLFVPGMMLIVQQFAADRRATAMGLYIVGGFSSNVLLNALGPALVEPLGWRWLFVLFSVSGLLVLALFWKLGDPVPKKPTPERFAISELTDVLKFPIIWLTGFIQFVRLSVVTAVAFWLPSLLIEDKGYSLAASGAVVAVGAAVTAPSNFLGGWISDRLNRPLLIIGISMVVLASTLMLISVADRGPALIAVVAVNTIFIQIYFGPLFAVPWQYMGAANGGMISGFGNLCANLGGITFTYLLGSIKDATGSFNVGLYALAAMCVAGLIAVWIITRLPVRVRDRDRLSPGSADADERRSIRNGITPSGPAHDRSQ